jgi:hypothetical protein
MKLFVEDPEQPSASPAYTHGLDDPAVAILLVCRVTIILMNDRKRGAAVITMMTPRQKA